MFDVETASDQVGEVLTLTDWAGDKVEFRMIRAGSLQINAIQGDNESSIMVELDPNDVLDFTEWLSGVLPK